MISYGSVAERSKALVLGTSLFGGVGSNPTAANIFVTNKLVRIKVRIILAITSMYAGPVQVNQTCMLVVINWLAEGSDSVIRFIYLLAKSKNHSLATVFTVFFCSKTILVR